MSTDPILEACGLGLGLAVSKNFGLAMGGLSSLPLGGGIGEEWEAGAQVMRLALADCLSALHPTSNFLSLPFQL